MAQLTDQSDFLKTALRLPRDLHARIQRSALANGRSMNAEIVERLREALDRPVAPAIDTAGRVGLDEKSAQELSAAVADLVLQHIDRLLAPYIREDGELIHFSGLAKDVLMAKARRAGITPEDLVLQWMEADLSEESKPK